MEIREATEKLQPIRDEFLARFYRWADVFSQDEFSLGFPVVSKIPNPNAECFLNFARSLNQNDRSLFRVARLKKFHPRGAELANDVLSQRESALLAQYSLARTGSVADSRKKERSLSKTQFRKMLLTTLRPVLGDPIESPDRREEWEYRTPIGCWTVSTRMDIGGRRVLGYEHAIRASESVFLHRQMSILSWMGVAAQTDWVSVPEAEQGRTLESIRHICEVFLAAIPELLKGLFHNLPEPEVREWKEVFTVESHRRNGYTVLLMESPDLRRAFGKKASWEVPTSIIPETLRTVGSRFRIIQDQSYVREYGDPLAMLPAYRHLRIESVDSSS